MLSNQISQQSISQSNNDQPMNYNLLSDDSQRSKQLMKLFNKKLSSIGVQKQIIDQIIQKGAGFTVENFQSRFEPKKGSLGKAGIQGELMNLQMVIAQQEIQNKPGGHILAVAPKIDKNIESIKEVKDEIVQKYQDSIETLVNERQKKRDVLINTSKHLKALNLIEQVENNIRKKKGSMNVDLSIDQNKIKYGKVKQDQSELSKLSEYLQNEQKKKKIRFIDKFDFSQFNDAEYDSDFAEQITLNAIHIDESNIQKNDQNQNQPTKSVQKIIPLLQKSPQVSSFKGTKFDKLINSPIDEKLLKGMDNNKKYRTNFDGSIIYSQEQINMIKEKTEIADQRVNQKINFDNKMKEIQYEPNLLEDANIFQPHEWSVDSSKEYPGTIKLTVPITHTLNRKQSNLIFKEDFEMKIVSMNNQIQKEIDEANKSLNFSRNLVGPHPTYIDMINQVDKKEANRVKMLLAKQKQNLMREEQNEDQNPFQLKNHLLVEQSTIDLNDSIYNTIDQSLENSVETPKMNIQDQQVKPVKMMSNWKKKKEEKIRKEQEKQKKLMLLNEGGRRVSPLSEYKGFDENKIETFSEKKQRENLQEYHKIRVLPLEERKIRIMEKSLQMNDINYDEELKKKKIFDFVNRINRDEEFPLNVIDKLIILTIQKINQLNKNSDISQLIPKDLSQDEIINGLCLLKALKSEAVQELILQQSSQAFHQTTKYLSGAAQLVREFKMVQKNNEEEHKIDPTMLLSRYLTQQLGRAASNLTQSSDEQNRQTPSLGNNSLEIYNSKLFQGVIKSLFNQEQSQQIIKKLSENSISSKNSKATRKSDNIEVQNQILQSLQQQMDEIINKILESDSSKVVMLKQELNQVKKEMEDLQDKIKAKLEENILNQVNINTKDQSVQQFARKINLSNEFFSICKFAEKAKIENDLNNNPVLNYYQNCRQAGALSLPVLNKIQNKNMIVMNYKLNDGVCSGIADAFQGNQKLVQNIIFESNGLTDKDFAKILQGARNLDQIKILIYRQNEFQFESLHSLVPIISKRKPQNLEELRIVNCKISSAVSSELIDTLINNSSGLKKLSLVNANITQSSFVNLLKFIEECRSLIDLDLSFNGFLSTQMFELIKVLAKNRKLENVNLSWNTFQEQEISLAPFQLEGFPGQKITKKQKKAIDRTIGQFSLVTQQVLIPENFEDQNKELSDVLLVNQQLQIEEIKEQKLEGQDDEIKNPEEVAEQLDNQQQQETQKEEMKQSPLSLQDPNQPEQPAKKKFEKEPPPPGKSEADIIWKKRQQFLEKFNKDLGKNLASFIKYNQNLFHLDLTSTGLNEELIKKIGISLNKSRALCCIHLSNNPGITERNIQFIQQRIKCKDKVLGLQLGTTILKNIHIEFKYPPIDPKKKDGKIQSEQIQENLKLQQIKKSMQAYSNKQNLITSNIENKLEISRYLGHQFDMPGSQQWCILNNPYDPLEKCWIYEQLIHTLIFWSPSLGSFLQEFKSIQHTKYKEKIVDQIIKEFPSVQPIEQIDSENKLIKRTAKVFQLCQEDIQRPLISCEFTSWKPKRMLRIEEYCLQLESLTTKKGIDFYDILRQQGKINQESNHKDFDLLDENEQKEYMNLKRATIEKYTKSWPQTVADEIRFKKPFLCNAEHLGKVQQNENIYVFPCYLKPGKQNYVIIQEENLASNSENEIDLPYDLNKYFIHKCIAENRQEEIPLFSKPFKMGKKQRKFKHDQSIFKTWKPDNSQTLESCLQHDFQFCKFSRFVKPIPEIVKVMDVLKKHFEAIKQIYHYLMSKSSYPGILFQDYNNWIIGLKLIDNNLDLPAVDRDFIAAQYVEEKVEGAVNPLNALCRYQFLEILVRVAKTKFEIKGQAFSHSACLEKLLSECILKNDKSEPWQQFRKKELWKLPVCDLLEPNLPGLKQVYESHFVLRKTNMDLLDCHELFYHKTGLLKQEKYVTYCFGMSKMTVVDEVKGGKKYLSISFIEFVEMIGRVAHFRYKDDPDYANVDLASKIEFVLDEVLGTLNIKRLDPIVIVLDESESDEDY